jgi:hypothetical protein
VLGGAGACGGAIVGAVVGTDVGTDVGTGTGSFGVGTGSCTVGTAGGWTVGTEGSCAHAGVATAIAVTPHNTRARTRTPSPPCLMPKGQCASNQSGAIRQTARMQTRRAILGAVAAALLSAAPAAAAPSGVVYGGETAQEWPVVVQLAKDRKSVAKLAIGLTLKCGGGTSLGNHDRYDKLKLTVSGRFEDSYGPVTTRNGDGTTTDYHGSVTGRVTSAKVTATSRLQGDFYDASGRLTDTCDSGKVSWTARP